MSKFNQRKVEVFWTRTFQMAHQLILIAMIIFADLFTLGHFRFYELFNRDEDNCANR